MPCRCSVSQETAVLQNFLFHHGVEQFRNEIETVNQTTPNDIGSPIIIAVVASQMLSMNL